MIGLDLSLRSPAACWIPPRWRGDVRRVRVAGEGWGREVSAGAPPEEHARRNAAIAEAVVGFATGNPHDLVVVESYAFSQNTRSSRQLHELGGVVRHELLRALGRCPVEATASAARAALLSNVPRKDSKDFVQANVRRLGRQAVYWSGDAIDAFVIANYGCKLLGRVHLHYEGK